MTSIRVRRIPVSHQNSAPSLAPRHRAVAPAFLVGVGLAMCLSCRSSILDGSASSDMQLSLSPAAETLTVGDSSRLSVLVSPPYSYLSRSASWHTSDPSVATVSANGEVWARGKGSATVIVTDG